MTARPDADGWSARLAHLAALARVDALAIVLPSRDGPATYVAHNLAPVPWSMTRAAASVVSTLNQRVPSRIAGASIAFADGRSADGVATAPIVWKEQVVGALVGLATRALEPD